MTTALLAEHTKLYLLHAHNVEGLLAARAGEDVVPVVIDGVIESIAAQSCVTLLPRKEFVLHLRHIIASAYHSQLDSFEPPAWVGARRCLVISARDGKLVTSWQLLTRGQA